jgi:hypothetical protein
MNISENVNLIEKESIIQNHSKGKFNLSTMLKLPIIDPQYQVHDTFYTFKTIAERNAFSLLNIMEVIKKDQFEKITHFDSNSKAAYAGEIFPQETLTYIDNVYNQWKSIADEHNLVLSDTIQEQKDSIVKDFKEFSQYFEDYRIFIKKYKILEPLYINNRHNPEEAPFFKEELDNLFKEYSNLLTVESAGIFFKNQTNFGISDEECVIPQLFARLTTMVDQMKAEIKEQKPEAIATMATKFVLSQSASLSDITNFLVTKNIEDQIKVQVQLTPSQNISGFVLFNDGSAAVKNRNGLYRDITVEEMGPMTHELIKSTIDYKFRKKPKLSKALQEKYEEDGTIFNEVDVIMNTYLDNEAILKNMKFDLNMVMENKCFESIDDHMNAILLQYKIERYANTILSNKYKHLLTDEAYGSFKVLYETGVSETQLQDLVGKKLASIKEPEEFEKYIEKIINQFNGFNPEALSVKLETMNIKPILTENDVFVFEVNTFEDSKSLGSASWCIARNQHHFDTYTGNGKRQFFIYDFNQNERSNQSMIGITLEKTGQFNTQHLKNDDYVSPTDFLRDVQKRLILKEVERYNLDNEMKKKLGIVDEKETIEADSKNKKTMRASI